MLTFVPIQIALSAGIALAFVLLFATTRRAAAGRWAAFYILRLAGAWLTVRVIESAAANATSSGSDAPALLIAFTLVALSQVALMDAVWSHAAPSAEWRRWRWAVSVFLACSLAIVATRLWLGSSTALEVALFTARTGSALANLLCVAVLWSVRSTVNSVGARFLTAGLALTGAGNLLGAAYPLLYQGTPNAYGTGPALAALQVVSVVALTFASLYVLLEEERDALHAVAVENEHSRYLESLGRVASGAAHDFNNVLGAIQLTAEAARESDTAADRHVELEYLGGAISRGQVLVDSLAAYARDEPAEVGDVDVGDAIRSLAPTLRRLLHANQTLHLDLPAEPLHVRLDRGQLDRALSNLVANARDAMPLGGAVVVRASSTLTVRGNVEARRIAIEVQDEGHGMPPEVLNRVFEPFFTTKELGRGTGLGLSLCHSFVTQQGGEARIVSTPGGGTTVTLLFPTPATVPL